MAKKSNNSFVIIIVIAAAAAGALGYKYLTTPRERSTEEKVNAALEEMQKGLEKAADELEDKRPIDELNEDGRQMIEDINKANGQPQNQ